MTSPFPHSCSPSTLMRLFTRSRTAVASIERSLAVVNEAHSGFCPVVSVFRYEIRYLGMATIGPPPSTAVPLHQLAKPMEQVIRVVRPRRSFRVVLHREHRPLAMAEAIARVVVEVHVARLPAPPGDGLGVDREAVVLRGDLHLVRGQILHGVVRAVMAERQLVRTPARGESEDLVAEADAEDRYLAQELAHRIHEVWHRFGVARAVREEDAIGL